MEVLFFFSAKNNILPGVKCLFRLRLPEVGFFKRCALRGLEYFFMQVNFPDASCEEISKTLFN